MMAGDVIVDFCAYEKGDIAGVLHNIRAHAGQYLLSVSLLILQAFHGSFRRILHVDKLESAGNGIPELSGGNGQDIQGV